MTEMLIVPHTPQAHLRIVPDPGAYQIHAGALTQIHVGKLVGTIRNESRENHE